MNEIYVELVKNDIRDHKLMSVVTVIFTAVSAMLVGLTILLFTSLSGSIDQLMEKAKTPDFLQMHAGEINVEQIEAFAGNHDEITKWQVCRFLNLNNGMLTLGGQSLSGNTQDNGLCVQNEEFDWLLSMDNEIIRQIQEGEVYVPICYKDEYGVSVGQILEIGEEKLRIAGFLRDSQMNSMMASSKRFLVSEADYDRLRGLGEEEYLIEFLLSDRDCITQITTAYLDAGLPDNGPAVTYDLIRFMNALSDGLMIWVLFFVSVMILLISILCIRFLLMTSLSRSQVEIGTLKAIGIGMKGIRRIYFGKYLILTLIGAISGGIAAALVSEPLSAGLREMYGVDSDVATRYLFALLAVAATVACILLSIHRTLNKLKRTTALAAMRESRVRQGDNRLRYLLIGLAVCACTFLCLVPRHIASTLASPDFVTYMGVGNSDVRIDVARQNKLMEGTLELGQALEQDSEVLEYTVLITKRFKAGLSDGTNCSILAELGDHTAFPVSYLEGTAPEHPDEIALSSLLAQELGLGLSDSISLSGRENRYTVCGIYSDITNGGKTAKLSAGRAKLEILPDEDVMWSILYVSLRDGTDIAAWIQKNGTFTEQMGAKITDIRTYVEGTYGQMIQNLDMVSGVVIIASLVILFTVVLLFFRLIVERERMDLALKKALGFSSREIKKAYGGGTLPYIVVSILLGVWLSVVLGQTAAGMVLSSLGASGFQFVTDKIMTFAIIPLSVCMVTFLAIAGGAKEVDRIKAFEAMRKE